MPTSPPSRTHQFEQLSHSVIGACIDVQRQLGVHCTEVDYQRALELALRKAGLQYDREVEIPITYEDVVITRRRVDFVIGDAAPFVATARQVC